MSIEQNLANILAATYGKDVRQAIHDSIFDINEIAKNAEYHASTAPASAQAYANAALAAEQAAQAAQQAAEDAAAEAMSGTPTGYADIVAEVRSLKTEESTVLAKTPTFLGRVLLDKMYGMSVQDGTPTPSVPVAIKSAKANFTNGGKNLFALRSTITYSGFTITANDDGTFTFVSGSNSSVAIVEIQDTAYPIIAKDTTPLKVSGTPSNAPEGYYLQCLDITSSSIVAYEYGSGATFTPVVGHSYKLRVHTPANTSISNVTFKPMLTLADADQTFEKYQGQSITTDLVLRAIEVTSANTNITTLIKDGHYYVADILNKIDGGHQKDVRIGHLVLNGTENWTHASVGDVANRYITHFGIKNVVSSRSRSNRFVINDPGVSVGGEWGIATILASGDLVLWDKNNTMGSVDGLKTWLASNLPEFDFILATPTTETVSNANAKKLLSLKSYDEATYVAQTEDTEGVMVIEYGTTNFATKALSGYVEAEQNSIRISQLENA